jgi:hypothetical protein
VLNVPVGQHFILVNNTAGAGSVTFAAGTGATVTGTTTPASHATVMVTKVATNVWSIG